MVKVFVARSMSLHGVIPCRAALMPISTTSSADSPRYTFSKDAGILPENHYSHHDYQPQVQFSQEKSYQTPPPHFCLRVVYKKHVEKEAGQASVSWLPVYA